MLTLPFKWDEKLRDAKVCNEALRSMGEREREKEEKRKEKKYDRTTRVRRLYISDLSLVKKKR